MYVCLYVGVGGVCVCMFQFGSKVFVSWVSFEKLKSDYNQTWVKDAIGVSSYVNEVIVTYQGQGSSGVKLGGKCWFSLFGCPLKS